MIAKLSDARQCETDATTFLSWAAERILLRSVEVERRLVATGWHDPVGLHDAAFKAQINGDLFADRVLDFLYGYLAHCGATHRVPDEVEALEVADLHGDVPLLRLDLDWLLRLIWNEEIRFGQIDEYAIAVAELAKIRDGLFRYHIAQIEALIRDADGVVDRTIRSNSVQRFAPTRIPKRHFRGVRRHAG